MDIFNELRANGILLAGITGWASAQVIKAILYTILNKVEKLNQQCYNLSGGNQQKAIIARELDTNPELLVAVQPTRGLDVGAIEYIHKQIINERDKGKAVLLVSLELDEVMNLSDRILVIYEGEIVAEVNPQETTMQELGLLRC